MAPGGGERRGSNGRRGETRRIRSGSLGTALPIQSGHDAGGRRQGSGRRGKAGRPRTADVGARRIRLGSSTAATPHVLACSVSWKEEMREREEVRWREEKQNRDNVAFCCWSDDGSGRRMQANS